MAHFNKGRADGNILLAIEIDRTGFSLGGGCHDGADVLALGENWSVWSGIRPDGGRGWSVAQILMTRSTTACFGLNNICRVPANVDTYFACVETYDGV